MQKKSWQHIRISPFPKAGLSTGTLFLVSVQKPGICGWHSFQEQIWSPRVPVNFQMSFLHLFGHNAITCPIFPLVGGFSPSQTWYSTSSRDGKWTESETNNLHLHHSDTFRYIFDQMLNHFAERQHRWHASLVIEGIHEIMPQNNIHLIHVLHEKTRRKKHKRN